MPEIDYNSQSGRISKSAGEQEKKLRHTGLFGHGADGSALVCATVGAGGKLRLAQMMDKHDTVGIDCVAACIDEIICLGALPLFFQGHISMGGENRGLEKKILAGLKEGCDTAGCGFTGSAVTINGVLPQGSYDITGFCVGEADKSKIIDKAAVKDGDAVIGLASSGLHLNGYRLASKVFDVERRGVREYISELGSILGDALLAPSRMYAKSISALTQTLIPGGMCRIADGGLYGSLPQLLPEGLGVRIERSKLDIPPIFNVIQKVGYISDREMFGGFNMGVGMCVIVDQEDAATAIRLLLRLGEKVSVIGEVKRDVLGVTVV